MILLDGAENHKSLRLADAIHNEVPEAKIVVMGVSQPGADTAGFVAVGASGFLMKDATFEEFIATVRAVVDGASVLPIKVTGALFAQIA